jgi:hypothetical protein
VLAKSFADWQIALRTRQVKEYNAFTRPFCEPERSNDAAITQLLILNSTRSSVVLCFAKSTNVHSSHRM